MGGTNPITADGLKRTAALFRGHIVVEIAVHQAKMTNLYAAAVRDANSAGQVYAKVYSHKVYPVAEAKAHADLAVQLYLKDVWNKYAAGTQAEIARYNSAAISNWNVDIKGD